jgi:hypothetical protein
MNKKDYAKSVVPTFKKMKGTTNIEISGNRKSLWLLIYYREKGKQNIQKTIEDKATEFPRLKYAHTSSACLEKTKAGYLYYVMMFTIEPEIKMPTKKDIKKAIESAEDDCNRRLPGYCGTNITNITYDDNEFDEDGDFGINYTGKLLFEDHSETWHECHMRYLTVKKYLITLDICPKI